MTYTTHVTGRLLTDWRLLCAIVVATCAVSCDAYLGASGIVYEWRDAPVGAQSVIALDSPDTFPAKEFAVLEGADLLLEVGGAPSRPPAKARPPRQVRGTSDSRGHFKLGLVVGLGRLHGRLVVQKPGYLPAEVDLSQPRHHQVLIALVAEHRKGS